jgi:hydrogenase-4 component F
MRLLGLILLPALGALLAWQSRAAATQRGVLVGGALLHAAGVATLWVWPDREGAGAWLQVDALGQLVLTVVSLLFLAVAVYATGFLRLERHRGGRVFIACLLAFLSAATVVTLSHHLALLWIGMEGTTLAVAPLVFHRHDRRSLEAVWKYLVLSSVGIALALFGTFFIAAAQVRGRPLVLEDLVAHAGTLQPALLRAGFLFLLVGYGTKMGLAPLHSWKPDTYGEAPSLVAGLMAGALTSCAFLALCRTVEVMHAARQLDFIRPPLLALGLASLIVSAAFVIGQSDLKRLLAYSSVEHMGILVLALGIGGTGSFGATLHLINNGLVKGLMFLAVGNVVLFYRTSEAASIRGVLRRAPWTGVLLLGGLFAVTGSPPFGLFVSEFTIVTAAISSGMTWLALALIALLAIIFVGMARMIVDVLYGDPGPNAAIEPARESFALLSGPVVLGLVVLGLGIYLPAPLRSLLAQAAQALGGVAP